MCACIRMHTYVCLCVFVCVCVAQSILFDILMPNKHLNKIPQISARNYTSYYTSYRISIHCLYKYTSSLKSQFCTPSTKEWKKRTANATNGSIPRFLVLPGSESTTTEITQYIYFSLL